MAPLCLAKILNEILNDDSEGNETISSPSVSSFLLSCRAHPGKINPSHFPQVFLSLVRFTRQYSPPASININKNILDRNTPNSSRLPPLSPARCYFQSLKKLVRLENSFPPSFLSFLPFFLLLLLFFFFFFSIYPRANRPRQSGAGEGLGSGPGGERGRGGVVTIEKSRKFRANLIYRRSHLRFATQPSFHPLTRRPRCREGIRGGQGWDPLDPCSFFRARIYY